jgi:hypothetical protein
MARPISQQQVLSPRKAGSAIAVAAAVLGTVLVLGAVALWFHYGTAVFFEMIAAGISACF